MTHSDFFKLPAFSLKIGFTRKRSRITPRISSSQKVPGWFSGNMDSFPGVHPKFEWDRIPTEPSKLLHRAKRYLWVFFGVRDPWVRPLEISLGRWNTTEARSGMIQQVGRRWRVKRQNLRKMGWFPKHPGMFEEWQHTLYCYMYPCTSHKINRCMMIPLKSYTSYMCFYFNLWV